MLHLGHIINNELKNTKKKKTNPDIFKMDNQKGSTAQHRILFSITQQSWERNLKKDTCM